MTMRCIYRKSVKRSRRGMSSGDLLEVNIDKVKVAREVCRRPADLGILDLEKRISEVVALIRRANR